LHYGNNLLTVLSAGPTVMSLLLILSRDLKLNTFKGICIFRNNEQTYGCKPGEYGDYFNASVGVKIKIALPKVLHGETDYDDTKSASPTKDLSFSTKVVQ
jgi:hypothetical protein